MFRSLAYFLLAFHALTQLDLSNASAPGTKKTVVVSGATGRTGNLLYKRLKAEGLWNVRAFVRNATKAKTLLGCNICDESEGIFVGDVSSSSSLAPVMKGADVLAVTTASSPQCSGIPFGPFGKCTYHASAMPKDIDWKGTKAQVKAFATSGGELTSKQVLYVSTMDTTAPDNFLDKIAGGYTSFYHLQAEAFIMSSGIPFTIAKACGLGDKSAGKNKLIVGHDDASFSLLIDHTIQRDDVARILVEAVRNPSLAAGLRFDVCSQFWGKATTNVQEDVLKVARLPWDHRTSASDLVV